MHKAIKTSEKQTSPNTGTQLTFFPVDFPVRNSVSSESKRETRVNDICGQTTSEQSKKSDLSGSFQKTFMELLAGQMAESSNKSVMTWNLKVTKSVRLYYQLTVLDFHTKGIEYGLLPTPLKDDWKGGTTSVRKDTGKQRTDQFRHWWKIVTGIPSPDPSFLEIYMGFPEGWTEPQP